MSSLFDKLNLSPQERRLVVIVSIVVFVVLNFWRVFPMFGEYGKYEQRIKDANNKLKSYQDEIGRKPGYDKELKDLETKGGYVPTEEAGLRLSQEITSQAALSGVTLNSVSQMQRQTTGKTNAFFDEVAVTVNISSTEKELIDFLWRLADKETLIRAKTMTLGTDPSRMRLQGLITLVKSFQRRPPPKTALTVPTRNVPAAAVSTNPANKPPPVAPVPAPKPTSPTVAPGPTPPPPTPSGGTNRNRRAMPLPARP